MGIILETKRQFKVFFNSFKLGKDFWYTFLADTVAYSLIFTVFTLFAAYVREKSVEIMQVLFDRRNSAVSCFRDRTIIAVPN